MSLQWNPFVIPLILSGLIAVVLIFRQFPRFTMPGTRALILILAISALWVFSYAFELISASFAGMKFWDQVQLMGVIVLPTLLAVFVIQSVGKREWLNRRNSFFLGIAPVLLVGIVVTSPWHSLLWVGYEFVDVNSNIYLFHNYGPLVWVIFGYSTVLILLAEGVLIYSLTRSLIYNRSFIWILMVGGILPLLAAVIDLLELSPTPYYHLMEITTVLVALGLGFHTERVRRGDLGTVSRSALFKGLSDGIMILDEFGKVIEINPAAVALLRGSRQSLIMEPLEDSWPAWREIKTRFPLKPGSPAVTIEFDQGRIFDVGVSDLQDWRAYPIGQIVQLREITDYHRRTEEVSALLDVGNTVSSTLDLTEVLTRLAKKLLEISQMDICTISEWSAGNNWVRGLVEYSQAYWSENRDVYALADYPTTRQVLTSKVPKMIAQGSKDPEKEWMLEMGLTQLLMLPLCAGERVVGLVELGSVEDDAEVTGTDLECAQAILRETAQWLESPLKQNGKEALLHLAGRLIQESWAVHVSISEWNPAAEHVWTVVEVSNIVWPLNAGPANQLDHRPVAARVLQTGKVEVAKGSDLKRVAGHPVDLDTWGAQAVAIHPISFRGEPIGIVELYKTYGQPEISEDQLRLWQALADQAAMAIMNARLYQNAQVEIQERVKVENQLRYDAYHDALTGLPNRALLLERLGRAIHRAQRCSGECLVVLFLDIDNFKNVNDSFGHGIGDKLLVQIGERLTKVIRDVDTVARLGGDEFVVLVERVNDDHHVPQIADRIQISLTTPFQLDGAEILTSPSIGIVVDGESYDYPEDILRDADIALYRAKEQGKSRYEIFNPTMRENILTRLGLEADLRVAITQGQFSLVYQPIIYHATGAMAGYEVLTRWQTADGRAIEPATFIPLAEETGLIMPLSDWIFEQACRQHVHWVSAFGERDGLRLSINLSNVQVFQPDFIQTVLTGLQDYGIRGEQVCLEITENSVVRDFQTISWVMQELKSYGLQVHLDNFGSGNSSLVYISQLPFDAIKIDRYFLSMFHDWRVRGMLKSIVSMGHDLGKRVIVQGVETQEQFNFLKTIGCDYSQGFYFSAGLNSQDFESYYLRQDSTLGGPVRDEWRQGPDSRGIEEG